MRIFPSLDRLTECQSINLALEVDLNSRLNLGIIGKYHIILDNTFTLILPSVLISSETNGTLDTQKKTKGVDPYTIRSHLDKREILHTQVLNHSRFSWPCTYLMEAHCLSEEMTQQTQEDQ